jgi:hypothetical protein
MAMIAESQVPKSAPSIDRGSDPGDDSGDTGDPILGFSNRELVGDAQELFP